jgi:hypothetical protein
MAEFLIKRWRRKLNDGMSFFFRYALLVAISYLFGLNAVKFAGHV